MKSEKKDLLLKDLCARLPYGVCVEIDSKSVDGKRHTVKLCEVNASEILKNIETLNVQPILHPISSMTEEEVNELFHILKINEKNTKEWIKVNDIGIIRLFTEEGKDFYEIADAIDYLHSIHIDYRGLIEKGLALEAPEGIYNLKEK